MVLSNLVTVNWIIVNYHGQLNTNHLIFLQGLKGIFDTKDNSRVKDQAFFSAEDINFFDQWYD